jgi:murein DD-endopeptidase MepM/ murein hydrolase activator NlpD
VPASSRSPRLARTVLLGACASGLVGLGLSGAGSPATVTVSSLSSTTVLPVTEPAVPHGIVLTAPRPTAPRATRSRALPAKKATTSTTRKTSTASKARRLTGLWVRPSSAGVISPYGPRWGRMHKGVDFGAHSGAPIYAIGDGVVVGTGYQSGESGYGQITIIRHSNGFYSAYAHQSSYSVHVGEHVSAGEVIGRVGSTGNVTGPHLHFEIRTVAHGGQINPRTWLRSHGVSV